MWGPLAAWYGRCNQGKADRARHKWCRAQKAITYNRYNRRSFQVGLSEEGLVEREDHRCSSQVGLCEGRPGRA